jgi:peptidoglycan-N-acetylglucosamine deacetylase
VGAPWKNWLFRFALSAVAAATALGIASLPLALWLRVGILLGAGTAAAAVAYRVLPAFDPLGRVHWRLPRTAIKRCALTFDDGPSPATGPTLDILARAGVPATFFVVGANVSRHPDMVRRAQAEGHTIGLHGMTHTKLHGTSDEGIDRQVQDTVEALTAAGVAPASVYRTPHGFKSPGVFAVARRRGLTLWAWSRGVWDTAGPSPDVLVRRATRSARSGMVLLLHDGRGQEASPDVSAMLEALPRIIDELKRRGFTFVRLTEA